MRKEIKIEILKLSLVFGTIECLCVAMAHARPKETEIYALLAGFLAVIWSVSVNGLRNIEEVWRSFRSGKRNGSPLMTISILLEKDPLVGWAFRFGRKIGAHPGHRVERLAYFLALFLPKRIRESYFEPYLEEIREDRLTAIADGKSNCKIVGIAFMWRCSTAFLGSLVCWAGDFIKKGAGSVHAIFFRSK